jgi:hypothetical protein
LFRYRKARKKNWKNGLLKTKNKIISNARVKDGGFV